MEFAKLQIHDIILPGYDYHSKNCVAYVNEIEFPLQHIANMLKDLANTIMTMYLKDKKTNTKL